jgi:hypothetical protein
VTKRGWVYAPHILTFFWDHNHQKSGYARDGELINDTELYKWCIDHNCRINYTWVECPDEETVVLFILRWS